MICKNCGSQIPDNSRFCTVCGAECTEGSRNSASQSGNIPANPVIQSGNVPVNPVLSSGSVPGNPVKHAGKSPKKSVFTPLALLFLVTTAALAVFCIFLLKGGSFGGKSSGQGAYSINDKPDLGFKTQEECVKYFAGQIAKGDPDGALQVFAIHHEMDNFNFKSMTDRAKVYNLSMFLPAKSSMEKAYNITLFRSRSLMNINLMCLSLTADTDTYLSGKMVMLNNSGVTSSDVEKDLTTPDLSSFKYVSMKLANEDQQKSSSGQNALKSREKVYGYDDYEDYQVTYQWNGDKYYGGATLVKYDGKWYLDGLNTNYGGQSSYCTLQKEPFVN